MHFIFDTVCRTHAALSYCYGREDAFHELEFHRLANQAGRHAVPFSKWFAVADEYVISQVKRAYDHWCANHHSFVSLVKVPVTV